MLIFVFQSTYIISKNLNLKKELFHLYFYLTSSLPQKYKPLSPLLSFTMGIMPSCFLNKYKFIPSCFLKQGEIYTLPCFQKQGKIYTLLFPKTRGDLYPLLHKTREDLYPLFHKTRGDLYPLFPKTKGDLYSPVS